MRTLTTLPEREPRHDRFMHGLVLGCIAAYSCAILALKYFPLRPFYRTGLALLPIGLFALYTLLEIRAIRRLDELNRRIQLEALVVAYPCTILFVMAVATLQVAWGASIPQWLVQILAPVLGVFYGIGLTLAKRRYE